MGQDYDLGPTTGLSRLIVNFDNKNVDALELIPPVLRGYVTRLNLSSSLMQILDFVDEDVLQAALTYLREEASGCRTNTCDVQEEEGTY